MVGTQGDGPVASTAEKGSFHDGRVRGGSLLYDRAKVPATKPKERRTLPRQESVSQRLGNEGTQLIVQSIYQRSRFPVVHWTFTMTNQICGSLWQVGNLIYEFHPTYAVLVFESGLLPFPLTSTNT